MRQAIAGPGLTKSAPWLLLPCPPSLLLFLPASSDDQAGACGASESKVSRSSSRQVAASADDRGSCNNTESVPFTLPSILTAFSTLLLAADLAVKLLSMCALRCARSTPTWSLAAAQRAQCCAHKAAAKRKTLPACPPVGRDLDCSRASHVDHPSLSFAPSFITACSRTSRKLPLLATSNPAYGNALGCIVRRSQRRTGGAHSRRGVWVDLQPRTVHAASLGEVDEPRPVPRVLKEYSVRDM